MRHCKHNLATIVTLQITKEVNNVKKKNGEDRDREYEKELTKDVKKQKKSHEADASHVQDERIKNILKEYSKNYSNNLIEEKRSQQHVMMRLWNAKRYSSSLVVSTTEPEGEKTKEICNKVVPPLRLKKIVREGTPSVIRCFQLIININISREFYLAL